MKEALQDLLGHPGLWLGSGKDAGAGRPVLPTGFEDLDDLLPGGGWPIGAVTEILLPGEGIGEMRLLLPSLARPGDGRRIAWIDPPHLPYAPALSAGGVRLSRVLVVCAGTNRDRLWAAELALRSGACGAVLAWPGECDDRSLRRLALAAEKGGCFTVLCRPEQDAPRPSAASLRLRLLPSPSGVAVEVLKGRGTAGRRAEILLGA
jgi:hypothetical protein